MTVVRVGTLGGSVEWDLYVAGPCVSRNHSWMILILVSWFLGLPPAGESYPRPRLVLTQGTHVDPQTDDEERGEGVGGQGGNGLLHLGFLPLPSTCVPGIGER